MGSFENKVPHPKSTGLIMAGFCMAGCPLQRVQIRAGNKDIETSEPFLLTVDVSCKKWNWNGRMGNPGMQ